MLALLLLSACSGPSPKHTPPKLVIPPAPLLEPQPLQPRSISELAQPAPPLEPPPSPCGRGQQRLARGCGDNPLPADGCYDTCGAGEACPEGTTCQSASADPCAGELCDACGSDVRVCLPPREGAR